MFLADQKFGAGDGFLVRPFPSLQILYTTQHTIPFRLVPSAFAVDVPKAQGADAMQNYYLYNWQCAPIDGGTRGGVAQQGSGIGVVML